MRHRLIVNLRGANGAGKSTIPMQMLDDPDMYVIRKRYQNINKNILTVYPNYGWIALGTYFNKTGGLDLFPNNDYIRKAFIYAVKKFKDYDILLEGAMASTIHSTYSKLFKEAEAHYPELRTVIISFIPPFEVCLERIAERNGGKPIKEERVLNKYGSVVTNVKKFKEDGFVSLKIDTSKVAKKDMLAMFLDTVEQYRYTEEG